VVRVQAVYPAATKSLGTPSYCTTIVRNWLRLMVRGGVTTSSWSPWRTNDADQPFTRTDEVGRMKSRLNRLRSWVARARIVVVPVSRSVSG
jgi:hypothetical protein